MSQTFLINWNKGHPGVYAWSEKCNHAAIETFAGFIKISGDGPIYIHKNPAGFAYGYFADGSGRNFYGQHTLTIIRQD